jgi:hypothetical protein
LSNTITNEEEIVHSSRTSLENDTVGSKSNISIRKNSKSSERNVSNSNSNSASGCSCSVESSKSRCDCIINYIKKSKKSRSNELDVMKCQQKQYEKIREQENYTIDECFKQQYCESNIIPTANNKSQGRIVI